LDKIGFCDTDELYVIGDAIDRGSDGIEILKYIKNHKNMTFLLGNHELMMLTSVDTEGTPECTGFNSELWLYYNGGEITFNKYAELMEDERKSLLLWLNRQYYIKILGINGKTYCLTHSYFNEKLVDKMHWETKYTTAWNMVWTSMFRKDDPDTYGPDIYKNYDYEFVTGHVPVQKVRYRLDNTRDFNALSEYRVGNLIDIDGGCGMGYIDGLNNGALFLRLDDMKTYPVPIC
jgi:serine/threonine protein phosphatase 1